MLLIEQKVELLRLSLDSQGVDPKASKSANRSDLRSHVYCCAIHNTQEVEPG